MSATTFAISALSVSGKFGSDGAAQYGLRFVRSLQDFAGPKLIPPSLGNVSQVGGSGGFFFVHDDVVRNKAGSITYETDRAVFQAYGGNSRRFASRPVCFFVDSRFASSGQTMLYDGCENILRRPNMRAIFLPIEPPQKMDSITTTARYLRKDCRTLTCHILTSGELKPWSREIARALLDRQREDGA